MKNTAQLYRLLIVVIVIVINWHHGYKARGALAVIIEFVPATTTTTTPLPQITINTQQHNSTQLHSFGDHGNVVLPKIGVCVCVCVCVCCCCCYLYDV
jgi:hypothetical protein